MQTPPANIDLSPEMMRTLLDTASASAVAMLLAGTEQFAVAAGELSRHGFSELCRALHRYWPASSQHDLNRYVGLYLDERFYYLFAKFLPQSEYLLSLVFPPQTPLVRIRQDMTDIMRKVLQSIQAQMPHGPGLERSLQFMLVPYPVPNPSTHSRGRAEQADSKYRHEEQAVPDQTQPKQPDQVPGWRPVAGASPGTSSSEPSGLDWVSLDEMMMGEHPNTGEQRPPETTIALPENHSPSQGLPLIGDTPEAVQNWQPLEEAPQPASDLVRLFHEDIDIQQKSPAPEQTPPSPEPDLPGSEPESGLWEEDTRPNLVDDPEPFEQIKLSDITFYLVPRANRQYILGELARRLREWFPGICETYGWQLDALSIRPDYIKWRLHDFPDALIHEMLEIIRRRTSERIFRVFPSLRENRVDNDFWSPGYLADRQNQDFSTQVLIAHVEPKRRSG